MAATPNCQILESAVLKEFPHARFGRYNCRHISSNPMRSWSQHAGSEPALLYFGNALDIWHVDHKEPGKPADSSAAHQAWLKKVYGFLAHTFPNLVDQLLGVGDAGHGNHVHVSTWPKMKSSWWYKPPCKGGKLKVINEDGTKGTTFGALAPPPPPPTLEDDMGLRRNDTGNAVAKLQRGILAWNDDALPEFKDDGDYGAETEDWVGQYQEAANLDTTQDFDTLGVADPTTIGYILSNLSTAGGPEGPRGPVGPEGPRGVQGEIGPGILPGDELTVTVK